MDMSVLNQTYLFEFTDTEKSQIAPSYLAYEQNQETQTENTGCNKSKESIEEQAEQYIKPIIFGDLEQDLYRDNDDINAHDEFSNLPAYEDTYQLPSYELNEGKNGIMNHVLSFWIVTFLISSGLVALGELVAFPQLLNVVSDFFEIGILGAPLFALAGLIVSNAFWFRSDNGVYHIKNYSQSILTTSGFAIAGFFLTSIALLVIIGCVVFAIIFGIINMIT